jgi:hypothetical protein
VVTPAVLGAVAAAIGEGGYPGGIRRGGTGNRDDETAGAEEGG